MTKDILQELQSRDFDYARIGIFDTDGVLRGKMISKEKLLSIIEKGFGFCNVVFAWDSNDKLYDAIEDIAYPDENAQIDGTTLRFMSWQSNRPFLLADFSGNKGGLSQFCPRTLLKRITNKAVKSGYYPFFGAEFEWFNFSETPQSLAEKDHKKPKPITPGMFGYSPYRQALFQGYTDAILKNTSTFSIPVEGIHTETGDGVYEAALSPAAILEAADRAALFKATVKETANQQGIIASFMAKWNAELPGCSGHIHQSLWNANQQNNLFSENGKMSALAQSYLAGQLYCLPYLMPMYAPTVNSYKRFVEGSWAAVSVSWGIENRTTAVRFISGNSEKSTRLELRVPGSDANPYLTMSAALASGLYGIQKGMKLEIEPTTGNEYLKKENKKLPKNLKEAIDLMASSQVPKNLFGENFVNYFCMTRQAEWDAYNKAVTDWELKRYFEII